MQRRLVQKQLGTCQKAKQFNVNIKQSLSESDDNCIEAQVSAQQWLNVYGLKMNRLNLDSILPQLGFKQSVDYDRKLDVAVKSKYSNGLFSRYLVGDGQAFNLTCSKQKLGQLKGQLERALSLYKERIRWLSSGSRRVFGVVCEHCVVIVSDFNFLSAQNFQYYIDCLSHVVQEQICQCAKFNIIRATEKLQKFQKSLVPTSTSTISSAVEWIRGLRRDSVVGRCSVCEAIVEATSDKMVEAVYLFTEGCSADGCRELIKEKVSKTAIPVNVVSFNCYNSGTLDFLKELAKLGGGRFHSFALNEDLHRHLLDRSNSISQTNNTAPANREKALIGWLREDVLSMYEEMEEARFSLLELDRIEQGLEMGGSRLNFRENSDTSSVVSHSFFDDEEKNDDDKNVKSEKKKKKNVETVVIADVHEHKSSSAESPQLTKSQPIARNGTPFYDPNCSLQIVQSQLVEQTESQLQDSSVTFQAQESHLIMNDPSEHSASDKDLQLNKSLLDESEIKPASLPELEDSKTWLNKHGLHAQKLMLYDTLSPVAFKHCDGLVKTKQLENSNSNIRRVKVVSAKYCENFVHVQWKDGSVRHVNVTQALYDEYESKLQRAIADIEDRIKLVSGRSDQLFGEIIENSFYLLIDASDSMENSFTFVKESLSLLLEDQIKYKDAFNLVRFGSDVVRWKNEICKVTSETINEALKWVNKLTVDGSTNTLEALRKALVDVRSEAVYLLTDGRPDQEAESILSEVRLLGSVPIHTISFNCNDQEANEFLEMLSMATGGRFRKYYHCRNGEPISSESDEVKLLRNEIKLGHDWLGKMAQLLKECNAIGSEPQVAESTEKRGCSASQSPAKYVPRPPSAASYESPSSEKEELSESGHDVSEKEKEQSQMTGSVEVNIQKYESKPFSPGRSSSSSTILSEASSSSLGLRLLRTPRPDSSLLTSYPVASQKFLADDTNVDQVRTESQKSLKWANNEEILPPCDRSTPEDDSELLSSLSSGSLPMTGSSHPERPLSAKAYRTPHNLQKVSESDLNIVVNPPTATPSPEQLILSKSKTLQKDPCPSKEASYDNTTNMPAASATEMPTIATAAVPCRSKLPAEKGSSRAVPRPSTANVPVSSEQVTVVPPQRPKTTSSVRSRQYAAAPKKPLTAGHTKTSLLRVLSSSGNFAASTGEWLLPDTREFLKNLLAKKEETSQKRIDREMKKIKKIKEDLTSSLELSTRQWLKYHGLSARKLTIMDALAPTAVPHNATYVPAIQKHVLAKVFDQVLPIRHIDGKNQVKLVNPRAVDLQAYENRLEKAISLFKGRLSDIVWNSLPPEEQKQFDVGSGPISFEAEKERLLEALNRNGWNKITEIDIMLMEDEIDQAYKYLQQARDLTGVNKVNRTETVESYSLNSSASHLEAFLKAKSTPKKELLRRRPIDMLRGSTVIARSEQDGLYYTGVVVKSVNKQHALVDMFDIDPQIVPTQFIIMTGGAHSCPMLRIGDFVLVKRMRTELRECYIPGVVHRVPNPDEELPRYYMIFTYTNQKVKSIRRNIVKIGHSRFIHTVRYIRELQSRGHTRSLTTLDLISDAVDDSALNTSRNKPVARASSLSGLHSYLPSAAVKKSSLPSNNRIRKPVLPPPSGNNTRKFRAVAAVRNGNQLARPNVRSRKPLIKQAWTTTKYGYLSAPQKQAVNPLINKSMQTMQRCTSSQTDYLDVLSPCTTSQSNSTVSRGMNTLKLDLSSSSTITHSNNTDTDAASISSEEDRTYSDEESGSEKVSSRLSSKVEPSEPLISGRQSSSMSSVSTSGSSSSSLSLLGGKSSSLNTRSNPANSARTASSSTASSVSRDGDDDNHVQEGNDDDHEAKHEVNDKRHNEIATDEGKSEIACIASNNNDLKIDNKMNGSSSALIEMAQNDRDTPSVDENAKDVSMEKELTYTN